MNYQKKKFWDNRINRWSTKHYSNSNKLLKSIIAKREEAAVAKILNLPSEINILELGCGTGRLAKHIIKNNNLYTGLDFSEVAINIAKSTEVNNTIFECTDISNLEKYRSDCVISLGLFDWLNDEEIDNIIKYSANRLFLHSVSINERTINCLLHKLLYIFNHRAKKPRYFDQQYFIEKFKKYEIASFVFERHTNKSFSFFIHNLNQYE